MEDMIRVACPCCSNKRLFDAEAVSDGNLTIKCPRCHSVVCVSFHNYVMNSRRIAEYRFKLNKVLPSPGSDS